MRSVVRVAVVLGLVGLAAAEARAHGGNFRSGTPDPGRSVPAPGDEPPRPPVTPRGGRTLPSALPSLRHAWYTWWELNAEAWDLPRGEFLLRGRIAVTPSGDGAVEEGRAGDAAPEPRRIHHLLLERARDRVVVPYLREILDPAKHAAPEMVAAALIAWARIATDDEVVPLLLRHASDPRAHAEVRESAVLGLGLLRRSLPTGQLPPPRLESIRHRLLALFDAPESPTRIRAWAIYALALLADQPYGDAPRAASGRRITSALFERLQARMREADLRLALVIALGMQPAEGVPPRVRTWLRRQAVCGASLLQRVHPTHALQAYVRLDGADRLLILRRALTPETAKGSPRLAAAAANALAEAAPGLTSEERVETVAWLLPHLAPYEDPLAGGLGWVAVGALLGADLRDGRTSVLARTEAADALLAAPREVHRDLRPFAALALAVAARGDRLTTRPAEIFRRKAKRALARNVVRTRGADEVVAPHVVAAGLARAEDARAALVEILRNRHRFPDMRGHAARALGLLGRGDDETRTLLREATRDRVHPFVQGQAVRALGMLAAPGACDELLSQLQGADPTRGVAVSLALALGRLGDPKAADRLVGLAKNDQAGLRVRTMAVVALGLVFDPESPPSCARLRTWAFPYHADGDLVALLGIL